MKNADRKHTIALWTLNVEPRHVIVKSEPFPDVRRLGNRQHSSPPPPQEQDKTSFLSPSKRLDQLRFSNGSRLPYWNRFVVRFLLLFRG